MIRRILCILLTVVALLALLPVMAIASEEPVESENPPYAQIEYDYASEVRCGTVRFINQIISGPLYHSDYWKEWEWKRIPNVYYGPGSECGTACMSMALSYVGVNKTPKDILDYGDGLTYFKDWGDAAISKLPVSDFETAMSNYLNGNGRYSPLVIHLPGYSERGHYVVVIGKINADTYEVLDPNNCAVKSITINGANATYVKNGYTRNDRIDFLCQWFNPDAAPAIIKNVYPASCTVKVKERFNGMSLPCTTEQNGESKALQALDQERILNVTELILNDWDEYWYKIQTQDEITYYVPVSKVEYQKEHTPQVTIADGKTPGYLKEGDYFALKGKIITTNSRLTEVSVSVLEGHGTDGEVMTSGTAQVNGTSFELSNSSIDSAVRFGRLKLGSYTYLVQVKYTSYYVDKDNTLQTVAGTAVLNETPFTVEAAADKEPPEKPVLKIEREKDVVRFTWDEVAHTTTYHILIQEEQDGQWEQQERIKYISSGITRTLPLGNYRAQVIAFNENAWNNDIDDWHQTASDEVTFEIVCEHDFAEGVVTKEVTCSEAGLLTYTCTLCGESKEEIVTKLKEHTPGPAATHTTDQICTVCDTVLEKATGVTEPTETEPTQEATAPETPPMEPEEQKEETSLLGTILAVLVFVGAAAGVMLFKKKYLTEQPREAHEMQETQS